MSIINQMLHDLEKRRVQTTNTTNLNYFDLNFIPTLSSSIKVVTLLYGFLITLALASATLLYFKITEISTTELILSGQPVVSDNTVLIEPENRQNEKISNSADQSSDSVQTSSSNLAEQQQKSTFVADQPKLVIKSFVKSTAVTKSVVHKQPRTLSLEQQAQNRYQAAYEHLLANQQEQAEEELRNALMLKPGHNKSRELLAGIYIKNGRINEARTLLQFGIRISPSHFIFAKLYARILMEQNDNITGISVLLRNPPAPETDSDYFALLAALYQKNKQHHKAAKLYSQLLKLRENHGIWWLGMAISLEALGNESQAKLAYEKAKNSGNLSKGLAQYTDQRVAALAEIAYP